MSVHIDNVFFRKYPQTFINGCRYLQLKGINYVYTAAYYCVTRHYLLDKPLMTPLDKTPFKWAVKDLPLQRKLNTKIDRRAIKKSGLFAVCGVSTVRELIDEVYVSVVGMGHLDGAETFRGLIDTKAEKLTIHTCLWELTERDHVLCVNQPEAPRKVSTKPIRKIRACNT